LFTELASSHIEKRWQVELTGGPFFLNDLTRVTMIHPVRLHTKKRACFASVMINIGANFLFVFFS